VAHGGHEPGPPKSTATDHDAGGGTGYRAVGLRQHGSDRHGGQAEQEADHDGGDGGPATSALTLSCVVRWRPPITNCDTAACTAPNASVAAAVSQGCRRSVTTARPIHHNARPHQYQAGMSISAIT
jgi:hypothetical protein